MASGLGAFTHKHGGRLFRCKGGKKLRKRLFCSVVKKGGTKGRRGSAKKSRGPGRLRTSKATYSPNIFFGPGGARPGSACKDKDGRSGMANKQGRCITPKRRK
ncbi:MAG: hypothetical protein Q8S13_08680 [Dehalococcoidia bacterium]|nr:hypothetical protein [Dehalococcoidia bacterium]